MENTKFNMDSLQELSNKELMETYGGGESIWYWIGYGAAYVAAGFAAFSAGAKEGAKLRFSG